MSTSQDITPQQRLTVVKHLASGKGLDVVASITRLSRDQVLDIGNHHGYPKLDRLAHAAELLAAKLEKAETTAAVSTETRSPSGVDLVDRPAPTRSAGVASTPAPAGPASSAKPDEFRILINTAKGMKPKRIQALANRILDDVAKLRGLIDDEQEKLAAQQRESAEKAAARAEVERLEKQLAAAKAKLRGGTAPASPATPSSTATTDGPSAADVRAWAAANDVDCPTRGRVPADVREAYDEAHQDDAA